MRRITLTGEVLTELAPTVAPARGIKLMIPAPGTRAVVPAIGPAGPEYPAGTAPPAPRSYTVRRHDPLAGSVDVDVALHSKRPAATWAAGAAVADEIVVAGPRDYPAPPLDADHHVLAADESGLPALATVLEHLPPGRAVSVLVEVEGPPDEIALPRPVASLAWLHRAGRPAGTSGLPRDALQAMPWPPGRVHVWIAAEGAEVREIRDWLRRERGLGRVDLQAHGYWRRGITNTELDRAVQRAVVAAMSAGGYPADVDSLDVDSLDVDELDVDERDVDELDVALPPA